MRPSLASQISKSPPKLHEASRAPSGLNATHRPDRLVLVAVCLPVATSQMRETPGPPAVETMLVPSGDQSTDQTFER